MVDNARGRICQTQLTSLPAVVRTINGAIRQRCRRGGQYIPSQTHKDCKDDAAIMISFRPCRYQSIPSRR